MMRYLKIVGRVVSCVLTAILLLLLIGNIYIIISGALTGEKHPTILGYSTAIVISGSMSGSIEVNDLVVIHKEKSYTPGDIITFTSGESLVTHRIVDHSTEGFITKGDANNAVDLERTSEEQIVGKVVLVIPRIGMIQQYMSTPLGMMCIVLIGALIIVGPSMFKSEVSNAGGDDDEKRIKG